MIAESTFDDLDVDRKSEIILLSRSLMIACQKLQQFSGIEAVTWLDQITEEADSEVGYLTTSQIKAEIVQIEEAYLAGKEKGVNEYLMTGTRSAKTA